MPLVIDSLEGGYTHTYTCTYRFPHRNNYKKPGGHQPAAVSPGLKFRLLNLLSASTMCHASSIVCFNNGIDEFYVHANMDIISLLNAEAIQLYINA